VKIVHVELTRLLGERSSGLLSATRRPSAVLLVGLQGSGKTTACVKLAVHLKGKRSLLVPADPYRPAARDQLVVLASKAGVPVFGSTESQQEPVQLCRQALEFARSEGFDLVIVDTAGRLHVDEAMMAELRRMQEALSPTEVLLVVDGMTGQDAVKVSEEFNRQLRITGVILTKMDGDARGGAALSIKAVTGTPIKFLGTGEGIKALEVFHPERVASRILGMGDVLSLVEKAEESYEKEKAAELGRKIRAASLTLEDFLDQVRQLRKMGPLEDLLKMVPGMAGQIPRGLAPDEAALDRAEAIIRSMTDQERRNPSILDGSRRRRIARGAGTTVQDVNRLLREFEAMEKLLRQASKGRNSKRLFGLQGR
jgi:signal recognition particle subunit SRP54